MPFCPGETLLVYTENRNYVHFDILMFSCKRCLHKHAVIILPNQVSNCTEILRKWQFLQVKNRFKMHLILWGGLWEYPRPIFGFFRYQWNIGLNWGIVFCKQYSMIYPLLWFSLTVQSKGNLRRFIFNFQKILTL